MRSGIYIREKVFAIMVVWLALFILLNREISDSIPACPAVPGDPLTAPFWAATRGSRLAVPECGNCGYLQWPPERLCPECQHADREWRDFPAAGTLWSYTVYYRALDPASADDIPYAVGLVELDAFALVSPVTLRTTGLLAKAVTTLGVLSGGRAVLGVGAGWDAAEHEAYGIPFAGIGVRMDQLDEAFAVYAKAGADGIAIVGPDDPDLIPAIGAVLGEAFPG
jgi:uncharacterized OB-fold protein